MQAGRCCGGQLAQGQAVMANDHISPLKKGTGSEPNRPGPGETTPPRGACTLFQRAVIPRPDARSHARRNNFVTYVNGPPADLGLAAADVVDLNNSAATWTADYPAHTAAQAARKAKHEAFGPTRLV